MDKIKENDAETIKTIGQIMLIVIISKILGLIRNSIQGIYYGLSMEANAFTVASLIPQTFFDIMFASVISASFIPVFNECLEQKGEEKSFEFANIFVTLIGGITFVLTLVFIILAKIIIPWFAPGFDNKTIILSVKLLRIMFPTIFLTGITYSLVSILQSFHKFRVSAALSIFFNVIIILYYLLFNKIFGIFGLSVVFVIGWLIQILVQIPTLNRIGYHYHFIFKWDGMMNKVIKLVLPAMLSTWVQPINYMVCTKFASGLFGGGGVSALNYANNLYIIIVGVLVSSVTNVIFPDLSRLSAKKNELNFIRTVNRTIKALSFILLPMMVGLFIMCKPLVQLIYGSNTIVTNITSITLRYYSLGMFGFGLQMMLNRVYFAKQRGLVPFASGIVAISINIILCKILINDYGIMGLSISSSISASVSGLILIAGVKKMNTKFFDKNYVKQFLKMCVATFLMGIVVIIIRNSLMNILPNGIINNIILLVIPTVIGFIVYMGIAYIMGIQEIKIILAKIKNKFQ